MLCKDCNEPISESRLKIISNAIRCTTCQSLSEDDVKIKRFDDSTNDGETQVSTYYFNNPVFDDAIVKFYGNTTAFDNNIEEQQLSLAKPIIYNGLSGIFEKDETL